MRYRQTLLDLINTSQQHPTAEQVFLELKKQYPSLVLATVYNNLNSLYQQGCIRKISIPGQPDRFDKNTRHDHLVCCQCGKLSDIHLQDLTANLEEQAGFPIKAYDLKIQYLCPECEKV